MLREKKPKNQQHNKLVLWLSGPVQKILQMEIWWRLWIYTPTLQIIFAVFCHLTKMNWRWMIHLLWGLWTVSTDVPNWPIFKDRVHHSSFKDSSRWTARENSQHCCDKGHLEKSNLKHTVLHTLWLLVSGCPCPDPCWHVLSSILICFIWKTSQRTTHCPKQQAMENRNSQYPQANMERNKESPYFQAVTE